MKEFAIVSDGRCWVVVAENKHGAIGKAVKEGYQDTMSDFYYGLEDGQIQVIEVSLRVG